MINRVVLVGRLTKDPELRRTQSGTSVVSYTIAVNRRSAQPGQPDADFINCVAWNKTAELMAQYLHKGSLIGVEGRIQTRNYENQQGQRVYVTEVVTDSVQFLEPKKRAVAIIVWQQQLSTAIRWFVQQQSAILFEQFKFLFGAARSRI